MRKSRATRRLGRPPDAPTGKGHRTHRLRRRLQTGTETLTTPPDLTSTPPNPPPPGSHAGVPRLPSLRVAAMLAAGMLALGAAVGAAIGPAPEASFAGASEIPMLLPALAALAARGAAANGTTPVKPAAVESQATPSAAASGAGSPASSASPGAGRSSSSSPSSSSSTPSTSTTPTTSGEGSKQTTLAAVTSVWLIELSGATFTQAVAQSAAAPYIDSQLLAKGTLLSGWSGIDASAFASEAPLLTGRPPALLDTIVEPPCPEGVAGAQCAPETAGALTAADSFLAQTIPSITASAAYRERGLIVVTFGANHHRIEALHPAARRASSTDFGMFRFPL